MVQVMTTDNTPPDDLTAKLVAIRDRAVRGRQAIVNRGRWEACRDAYYGLQYRLVELPEWKAKLVSPKMFEIVERLVPTLTDSKPKPSVGPEEPRDEAVARLLMEALEREWDTQDMQLLLPTVLRDCLIYGTGFLYTGFEPGYGGADKLYTRRVSPWNVFCSPGSTSDREPDAVIVRDRLTEADIWCYWPDLAERITRLPPVAGRSAVDSEWGQTQNDILENEALFYVSGTNAQLNAGTGSFEVSNGPSTRMIDVEPVWEFWQMYLRDPRTTPQQIEGPMTPDGAPGEPTTVHARNYPYGRFVTLVGNERIPELDKPNPLPHRKCPLIPVRCYDVGHYFGMSYLARLLDADMALNQIDNRILDCIALTLNPERVVSDDSNIDIESFSPYPGVIVKKRAGSEYELLPPPGLPQYVFEERNAIAQMLNDASGLSDISKGNYQGMLNDISGTAIQRLQEPTYTRIRAILRNIEKALTLWMAETVTNMVVFRPEPWWQRTFGPYKVTDPNSGQDVEQPYPWSQWTEDDLDQLPDIRMSVGSSLPTDKQARFNTAINEYDRQVYGPIGSPDAVEQVLKASDNPDREKIVAHVRQLSSGGPKVSPVDAATAAAALMQGVAALTKAGAQVPWDDLDMLAQELGLPPDWGRTQSVPGASGPEMGAPQANGVTGLNKATGLGQSPAEQSGLPEGSATYAGTGGGPLNGG